MSTVAQCLMENSMLLTEELARSQGKPHRLGRHHVTEKTQAYIVQIRDMRGARTVRIVAPTSTDAGIEALAHVVCGADYTLRVEVEVPVNDC